MSFALETDQASCPAMLAYDSVFPDQLRQAADIFDSTTPLNVGVGALRMGLVGWSRRGQGRYSTGGLHSLALHPKSEKVN
jgi:hypothetical protein